MKKKLSIILACVMLAALVLGSVTVASADATVPTIHPAMSLTTLEDISGASDSNKCQDQLYIPDTVTTYTIVDDTAVSDGKLKKLSMNVATTYTYNGNGDVCDISAYDGLVFRVKTEGLAFKGCFLGNGTDQTTFYGTMLTYITTDGQITVAEAVSQGIIFEVPANFDGYVVISLDSVILANGAGVGTRNGNVISNGDASASHDLTQYKQLALQGQFTADADQNFYLGNLYGYTTSTENIADGSAAIKDQFAQFTEVDAIYNLAATVNAADVLTLAPAGMTTDMAEGATQGMLAKYAVVASPSGTPYIKLADASNYEGIMFRLKTDVALSSWGIAHTEDGGMAHPGSYTLLGLDGTVTVLPYSYSLSIPAGFDGYVMFSLDKLTGAGGGFSGVGSRLGNTMISDSNWADSGYDLSKLTKLQFATWATTAGDANGANAYYVGNAYLYSLPAISDGSEDVKTLIGDIDTITAINNVAKYDALGNVPFIKTDQAPIGLTTDKANIYELRTAVDSSYYTYTGSLAGVDALIYRYQTTDAAKIYTYVPMTGRNTTFYLDNVTLIALDGTKVVPEGDASIGSFCKLIPAGFDGYIMFELDNVIFDGGNGGTIADGIASNEDGSVTADLSKVKMINIQTITQGDTASTFSLGSAYLATLVEPAPSVEPSVEPSAGASVAPSAGATSGPAENDPTGAPLMIGVALAALASASFVLKRKK